MAPSHASGILNKRCVETLRRIQRTQDFFFFFFFFTSESVVPSSQNGIETKFGFSSFVKSCDLFFSPHNILFCCLTPDKPPLFHCSTSDKLNS